MKKSSTTVWKSEVTSQFAQALTLISDVQTMRSFLRDVMTEKEILEISARLTAAQMLQQGKKYTEIIESTGLSSRTLARISDWMQNGCNGYEAALTLIGSHDDHMLPARA